MMPMISASAAVRSMAMRSAPALKPCDLLGVDELEALAERAAVILDRLPERRIGRVVDDAPRIRNSDSRAGHTASSVCFSISGRLAIGRDVDRDLRVVRARRSCSGTRRVAALADQPPRGRGRRRWPRSPRCAPWRSGPAAPAGCRPSEQREGRSEDEIVALPDRRRRWRPRRRRHWRRPSSTSLHRWSAPTIRRIGSDSRRPTRSAIRR